MKIDIAYARWNEEALEAGSTDDHGFVVEDREVFDAEEAVDVFKYYTDGDDFCEASSCTLDADTWFTTTDFNDDKTLFTLHIEGATLGQLKEIADLLHADVKLPKARLSVA